MVFLCHYTLSQFRHIFLLDASSHTPPPRFFIRVPILRAHQVLYLSRLIILLSELMPLVIWYAIQSIIALNGYVHVFG